MVLPTAGKNVGLLCVWVRLWFCMDKTFLTAYLRYVPVCFAIDFVNLFPTLNLEYVFFCIVLTHTQHLLVIVVDCFSFSLLEPPPLPPPPPPTREFVVPLEIFPILYYIHWKIRSFFPSSI
jgi:hypothetical protein